VDFTPFLPIIGSSPVVDSRLVLFSSQLAPCSFQEKPSGQSSQTEGGRGVLGATREVSVPWERLSEQPHKPDVTERMSRQPEEAVVPPKF